MQNVTQVSMDMIAKSLATTHPMEPNVFQRLIVQKKNVILLMAVEKVSQLMMARSLIILHCDNYYFSPFFISFCQNKSFVTAFYHILYLGENNQNSSLKMDTNDKNVNNGNYYGNNKRII